MTKTLKEILTEKEIEPFNKDDCFSRDRQDAFLVSIKDWLTQFHNEQCFSKRPIGTEIELLDRLLEEL